VQISWQFDEKLYSYVYISYIHRLELNPTYMYVENTKRFEHCYFSGRYSYAFEVIPRQCHINQ